MRYRYSGPVYEFDKLLVSKWEAETIAPTAAKARSNMIFQFKKQNNRTAATRITLTGDIIKED